MYPSFKDCELIYNVFVKKSDVTPYMTDSPTYGNAVNAYLQVKEENWLLENPKPNEARLIQGWFVKKLTELYPDYQFVINGREISTEEVLKMNIFTWNVKLDITYDEELSKALEKE